jgi:hypothetical protein
LEGTGIVVKPSESKYGLGDRIKAAREANSQSIIAGIRDRDFDNDQSTPIEQPRDWIVDGGKIWLGWYWERKEIENYLLDPIVVSNALRLNPQQKATYEKTLADAAKSIRYYTAARTALSVSRKRYIPLASSWGRDKCNNISFPQSLRAPDCIKEMGLVVKHHRKTQLTTIKDVLIQLRQIRPTCKSGIRYQHYLTFFAGKDLLVMLNEPIKQLNLASSCRTFSEKILSAIESSSDDIWTWLPEWQNLREQIIHNQRKN